MSNVKATVLYRFDGQNDCELNVNEGETVTVVRRNVGAGWWEVRNSRGQAGLIPESYCEITNAPEPTVPPPPSPLTSVLQAATQRQGSVDDSRNGVSSAASSSQPVMRNVARPPVPQPPVTKSAVPNPVQKAAQASKSVDSYDDFDDDDDDWDDDDDEFSQQPSTSGQTVVSTGSRIDRHSSVSSDIQKYGTVRKTFGRFSQFSKQGGEAYLFSTEENVPDSVARSLIVESTDGCQWKWSSNSFSCSVSNPKKDTKFRGIKTYIAYQVKPSFSGIVVTRRYKQFDWLHDRLLAKFCTIIIPPLPEKQIAGRFEEDFVQERMKLLQLWIDRLCQHPIVAYSDVFQHFLTCTDVKQWKGGKRKSEKDEFQGTRFFFTVQAPARLLDPEQMELQMDTYGRAVRNMDDSVRHLYSVGDSNRKKHQGPFKKEFQKLGEAFDALARSFEYDDRKVAKNLTGAIDFTGKTYQTIGSLFAEQPKNDMNGLLEGLWEYKGLLSTLPDIIGVQRAATSATQENTGRLSGYQIDEVQKRADTITYSVMAEINHYREHQVVDFKRYMQNYLKGQIDFYKKVSRHLEDALAQYSNI